MGAPDLLLIITTQWRADATGYSGDPWARTPSLDRLAGEGIDYCQAVTPHPFGPFARAALLTGVPSPENGVAGYFDPLPTTAVTLAHRMRDRGYATAFFGKWHLAPRDRFAPLVGEAHARTVVPAEYRGGFEFWEGFEGGFLLNDPWLHGTRLPEPIRIPGYQSDVVCDRAVDWLQQPESRPRLVMVSLEPPHPPYLAAAAGIEARPVEPRSEVPPPARSRAARELAGYYAHVEATDRAIGRLLQFWGSDRGVIVTSAHGDMHGAHGLFRKGWPYEESIRIPFLARPPFEFVAGVDPCPISLVDVVPLLLAWSERRSWSCRRNHAPISMPSVVALPDQCDCVWSGVRTAERKLIVHEDGSPWLAFDLLRDPREQANLAAGGLLPSGFADLANLLSR